MVARTSASAPIKAEQSPAAPRAAPLGPTGALLSDLGNAALSTLLVREQAATDALQRACCDSCAAGGPCEAEERQAMRSPLDERTISGSAIIPSSSGEALDAELRNTMEQAFGSDFSRVRIHNDAAAHRSAGEVNAKAFTVGQNIYFGAGYYAPDSADGRRLVTHELTHTVQQPREAIGTDGSGLNVSKPDDPAEREAASIAESVESGRQLKPVRPAAVGALQRDTGAPQASATFNNGSSQTNASLPANSPGHELGPAATTSSGTDKTRADLASRVAGAHARVESAGPNLTADDSKIAPLNAQVALLNAAVPVGVTPIAQPVGEALIALLGRIAAFLLGATMAEILLTALIIIAVIALISFIVSMFLDSSGRFTPPFVPGPQPAPPQPAPPQPAPPQPAPPQPAPPQPAPPQPAPPQPAPPQPAPPQPAPPQPAPPQPAPPQPAPPEPAPPQPAPPQPAPKPLPDPLPKPAPEPEPEPPDEVHPIPQRPCRPTGLSPLDPIPMTWFKPRVDDYYPKEIVLDGKSYGRDNPPTTLKLGEPIGVSPSYWPRLGKKLQITKVADDAKSRPNAARFVAVLKRYGFDWSGFQADHVEDIQFMGPDTFDNLWPLDKGANTSAGIRTDLQSITMCPSASDPMPVTGTLRALRDTVPNFYGRYFAIRNVTR
jgi:hypothetical protein